MTETPYHRLEDVVRDELFPAVDLALRHGRHVDPNDEEQYGFLSLAEPFLEDFYSRFGCELVRAAEGYFFLLPSGERLPQRVLTSGEMLAGQALALLYLDPGALKAAGIVPRAHLLEVLSSLVGTGNLAQALNPRRGNRRDQKVDEEAIRREVDKALRTLARLGFVDVLDADRLRLRAPLFRFAEPVRGIGEPAEALRRLVAQKYVVVAEQAADQEQEEA